MRQQGEEVYVNKNKQEGQTVYGEARIRRSGSGRRTTKLLNYKLQYLQSASITSKMGMAELVMNIVVVMLCEAMMI